MILEVVSPLSTDCTRERDQVLNSRPEVIRGNHGQTQITKIVQFQIFQGVKPDFRPAGELLGGVPYFPGQEFIAVAVKLGWRNTGCPQELVPWHLGETARNP